ncbi:MAG: orotate phosphoribosyltransferase [Rhodospirillales bacterium]
MSTDYARETARRLLDIKAVNFRPEEPYTLTSGWASPVYVDCRWVISFVEARRAIVSMAVEMLGARMKGGWDAVDYVAGGETAGIPYGAWIAEAASKPMLYIRKKPKGFGRGARIEGSLAEGARVLLVEDLATDGASKISFIDAVREAGGEITDAFVVFFYAAFPGALDVMRDAGVDLHHLSDWSAVLAEAERGGDFPPETLAQVQVFLDNPPAWSAAHGGRAE